MRDFPDSSVGKEFACNAEDPCSIPGSGRSAGAGDSLPSPVFLGFPSGSAVKYLPVMQAIPIFQAKPHLPLGWEDALGKGKATHSSILAWRIPRGHRLD